jgi:hypothetical protein
MGRLDPPRDVGTGLFFGVKSEVYQVVGNFGRLIKLFALDSIKMILKKHLAKHNGCHLKIWRFFVYAGCSCSA